MAQIPPATPSKSPQGMTVTRGFYYDSCTPEVTVRNKLLTLRYILPPPATNHGLVPEVLRSKAQTALDQMPGNSQFTVEVQAPYETTLPTKKLATALVMRVIKKTNGSLDAFTDADLAAMETLLHGGDALSKNDENILTKTTLLAVLPPPAPVNSIVGPATAPAQAAHTTFAYDSCAAHSASKQLDLTYWLLPSASPQTTHTMLANTIPNAMRHISTGMGGTFDANILPPSSSISPGGKHLAHITAEITKKNNLGTPSRITAADLLLIEQQLNRYGMLAAADKNVFTGGYHWRAAVGTGAMPGQSSASSKGVGGASGPGGPAAGQTP